MNQRIRELVEQAGGNFADNPLEFAVVFGELDDFEKFAELIVRECVEEARDDCAGWTERDQCLVMQVMDRIMLHFGVEE